MGLALALGRAFALRLVLALGLGLGRAFALDLVDALLTDFDLLADLVADLAEDRLPAFEDFGDALRADFPPLAARVGLDFELVDLRAVFEPTLASGDFRLDVADSLGARPAAAFLAAPAPSRDAFGALDLAEPVCAEGRARWAAAGVPPEGAAFTRDRPLRVFTGGGSIYPRSAST